MAKRTHEGDVLYNLATVNAAANEASLLRLLGGEIGDVPNAGIVDDTPDDWKQDGRDNFVEK
jgi:hypothetical protein